MNRPGRLDKSEWANATFEQRPARKLKLRQNIERILKAGMTLSVFGGPGTGKTSETRAAILEILPHGRGVYINGPTCSVEELVFDAPMRDPETGEIILVPQLAEQLQAVTLPDGSIQPWVAILDDVNQSEDKTVQNMLMQWKNDRTLQSFDLAANGCVAVIELNNDSLTDTNSITTDLAALDRVVSITVGANDTDWRWALAEKYSDIDLTEVFNQWAAMPAEMRRALPPRVLDHVIEVLLLGYPGKVGLPLEPNGHRRQLATTDGDKVIDRTDETISKIAAAIGAPNPQKVENIVAKAVRDSIRHNLTILIEGPPGGGKTALTMATIAEELTGNPRDYYFSLPTTDPERFAMPMPDNGVIKQILTKPFATVAPKAIVIDEANRGHKTMQAMLMGLNQERLAAGQEVPGLTGIINIQNPQYVMGRKMTVNKRNRAQSERFTINLQLNELDIKSNEWLLTVFPDKWADHVENWESVSGAETRTSREKAVADAHVMVETVLEWFKHDLDDEGRQWVTSRGIERLVRWLLTGGDPDDAIIHFAPGERAPVVTAALRARLAERPMTNLQEIVANKDEWIQKMKDGMSEVAVHGTVDVDLVQQVLEQSEVSQLQEHFDVVVELLYHLPRKHRSAHLAAGGERSKFYVDALREMAARYGHLKKD